MRYTHELMKGYTRTQFLQGCIASFKFFAEKVCGANIQPFHQKWNKIMTSRTRGCISAFRGSGKSYVCGVLTPLHLMAFDNIYRQQPQRRGEPLKILVTGPELSQSKKILRDIKEKINQVEFLYNVLYPESTWKGGQTWTKTEIETKNGCEVICQAYKEEMRSKHVNHIIVDEGSLLEDLSIFDRALVPMASKHPGNITITGTPIHETDLISRCKLPGSGYTVDEFPAYEKIPNPQDPENPQWGNNVWPWRYSDEFLENRRRELGELGFAREYLCMMISDESRVIPSRDIVACFSPGKNHEEVLTLNTKLDMTGKPKITKDEKGRERLTTPMRVMGTDLAMSPQGDYSVATVLEQYPNPQSPIWRILHLSQKRGLGFKGHVEWLNKIHKSYNPTRHGIDKSQFGQGLIDTLRAEKGINTIPVKFTPTERKELITGVIQMMESHRILIPRNPNEPNTLRRTDELIHQLGSLINVRTNTGMETYRVTCKHDDYLMSLGIAIQQIPRLQTNALNYKAGEKISTRMQGRMRESRNPFK